MEEHPQLDEETLATLKRIHADLELEDAVEEEINWQDVKPMPVDPVDLIVERVNSLKEKIYKKFKKSKAVVQELLPGKQSEVGTNFKLTFHKIVFEQATVNI